MFRHNFHPAFSQEQQRRALGSCEDGCDWYAGLFAQPKLNHISQLQVVPTLLECMTWAQVSDHWPLTYYQWPLIGCQTNQSLNGQVSDHSPCTPDLKRPGHSDFMAAWGGISSLQVEEEEKTQFSISIENAPFSLAFPWHGARQRSES